MPYYNYLGVLMPEGGGESSDHLLGSSAGNETLTAPAGNASLSGEGGGDRLVGSSGDNHFFVTNPHDVVVEQPGGGIDTEIGYTSIKLAPNVENLTVHQDFNYAVGNSLDNLIIVDGSQWVSGGGGNDVLVGSATQRTSFMVRAGEGSDVIYNWNGNDQLQLTGYNLTTAAAIRGAMTQSGADTVLQLSSSETLTFRGVTPAAFVDRQFLLPLDTSKLGAMTFDDEFNILNVFNPSTGAGQWLTNFNGNLKDQYSYTLVSNGETQAYVAPGFQGRGEQDIGVNPFGVSNGVLTITAAPVSAEDAYGAWNRDYTSGMLNTIGSFAQKYGYFEMRAELPTATGSWPAFWMLPSPYAPGAEADIMEGLALTPNVDYRHANGGTNASESLYDNIYKADPTGFHTYGMLWTPQAVTFYYDGVAVLTGATPSTWTSPMAMIVNLATGGWGGATDASQFPAQLKVDYIHAYALADGSSQVVTGTPARPVDTLIDEGAAAGHTPLTMSFMDGSGAVSTAHIQIGGTDQPTSLPAGKTFMIWEHSGAVFGAVSDGSTLAPATTLMAGSISQFTGAGTWLTNGKVVFAYYMPNATGGHDLWDMVFDPAKKTFVREDLGAAASDAHVSFVAVDVGGFAVSWHAPDGSVVARGYDEYAYGGDVPGWYGPVRQVTGDLIGVDSQNKVLAANGSGQEVYSLYQASAQPASTGGSGGGSSSAPTADGDNLTARAGATEIHAAAGNDTITGMDGSQTYLRGDDGNDSISGGSGFDDANGNMGNDTIHGNAGDDYAVGGKDNDLLFGDAGNDIVWGNLGDDTCDGGEGNDQVRGGQGNDVVNGGAGNDFVSGDRGDDTVTGGAGADIFHGSQDAGIDRVMDFHQSEGDRVMLDPGTTYTVSQVGADTVIDMGAPGQQMILVGVQLSSLSAGWIFTG